MRQRDREYDRQYEATRRRRYRSASVRRVDQEQERITSAERLDYLRASPEEREAVELTAQRMIELEAWWGQGDVRSLKRPEHLENPGALIAAVATGQRRMTLEKAACERAHEIRGGSRGAVRKAQWRAA